MTAWLSHGPLGPPGAGYGYGGLVPVPFNLHERITNATSPWEAEGVTSDVDYRPHMQPTRLVDT